MSGIVDDQIVLFGERLAQFVERIDNIVAGRIFEQLNAESIFRPQGLGDGAGVLDRRLQARQVFVVVDADDQGAIGAVLDVRDIPHASDRNDLDRLVAVHVVGRNPDLGEPEFDRHLFGEPPVIAAKPNGLAVDFEPDDGVVILHETFDRHDTRAGIQGGRDPDYGRGEILAAAEAAFLPLQDHRLTLQFDFFPLQRHLLPYALALQLQAHLLKLGFTGQALAFQGQTLLFRAIVVHGIAGNLPRRRRWRCLGRLRLWFTRWRRTLCGRSRLNRRIFLARTEPRDLAEGVLFKRDEFSGNAKCDGAALPAYENLIAARQGFGAFAEILIMNGIDLKTMAVAFDTPRSIAIVAEAEFIAVERAVRVEGYGPIVLGTARPIVRIVRQMETVEQSVNFRAGELPKSICSLREL